MPLVLISKRRMINYLFIQFIIDKQTIKNVQNQSK